jgi:hypothetical protein
MTLPASLQVSTAREDHSLSALAHLSSTCDSTHETASEDTNFRDTPQQVTRRTDVSHLASLLVIAAREDNSFSPQTHVPSTRNFSVESDSTPHGTLPTACRDSPSHDGSGVYLQV